MEGNSKYAIDANQTTFKESVWHAHGCIKGGDRRLQKLLNRALARKRYDTKIELIKRPGIKV